MPLTASPRARLKTLGLVSAIVVLLAVGGLFVVTAQADRAAQRTAQSWRDYVTEVQSKVALLSVLRGEDGFAGVARTLPVYVQTQNPQDARLVDRRLTAVGTMIAAYRDLPLSQGERFAVRALEASLAEYRDKLAVARHMAERGVDAAEIAAVVPLDDNNAAMALELLREAWTAAASRQRDTLSAGLERVTTLTNSTLLVVPVLLLAVGVVGALVLRQSALIAAAERGRAEARDVAALYRDLVEGSLQGLIIHQDFKPLFINRAFARMFGFNSVEEALGLNSFLDLVEEGGRADLDLVHGKIRSGDLETWTGRVTCRDRTGNTLFVDEMVRPILWRGEHAVQVTLLDVTDRVRHENDMEMERGVTERQAQEVVALAEELDAALQLAEQQKEQLHRLSISDPLTGAYNRRQFMECARQEIARLARQPDRPLSVIMLDIDHFKRINDTHGHVAGDEALRAFTRTCQETLRENDVFGRLGGEEFAVLLPDTDEERAASVAERLRTATSALEVTPEGSAPFRFTVSLGVAQVASAAAPFEATLSRADGALYQSKTEGRDRVTVAPVADAEEEEAAAAPAEASAARGRLAGTGG